LRDTLRQLIFEFLGSLGELGGSIVVFGFTWR